MKNVRLPGEANPESQRQSWHAGFSWPTLSKVRLLVASSQLAERRERLSSPATQLDTKSAFPLRSPNSPRRGDGRVGQPGQMANSERSWPADLSLAATRRLDLRIRLFGAAGQLALGKVGVLARELEKAHFEQRVGLLAGGRLALERGPTGESAC